MFKLTRAKYMEALESVEEMQTALETEMENLGISCEVLSNNWFGQQAENTLSMMRDSLRDGNYRKAYAYTKGITQIMGEYLPEIEKMMAKREQIGKQLYQDYYYTPDLSSFEETELIVDYAYIDDVKADADGAVMYGEKAAEILEEMYEIPPKARAFCQATIMNLAEGLLSEGECWKGLNGEQATIGDALVFGLYGFGVILDAGNDTVGHYINELIMSNAKKVSGLAEKLGLPEEYAQGFYTGMCAMEDFIVNAEETVSDLLQEGTYIKKQIQQEMIYYVEEKMYGVCKYVGKGK